MGGRKLLVYVCNAVATIFYHREFKIPQRRRGRKRHLKSDLAFFETSVQLSQHAHFVLCPGVEFLKKIFKVGEKEKFVVVCSRCRWYVKLGNWRRSRAGKEVYKKCVMQVQSCCFTDIKMSQRRPCWCPKLIVWDLNLFLFKVLFQ